MGVTVIIPVYNEEKSISSTISTIRATLEGAFIEHEIIVVNDGSLDKSKEILSGYDFVKLLNHRKNKGYGASIKTGLRHAKYNDIIITDADGTYPNERLAELYAHYKKHHLDMLVGSRNGDTVSYPFIKKIPKFFISHLSNYISNTRIPDINSGLRLFRKDVAMKFYHLYPQGFSFTTTITLSMLCGDYDVEYVPINYMARVGKSKVRPIKDTVNFFKLLLRIALYFNPFKFFAPIIGTFSLISAGAIIRDVFILRDLTQSSVIFPTVTLLFFVLGLLADLIIKRTQ